VKRTRNDLRRAAAAAGIVLQFVFLLAAAAPRMVWCHRPGGETVLEFEIAAGECRCDQCALCKERGHAADHAADPAVRASHCRHNEIDSEAGRSSNAAPSGPNRGAPDPAFEARIPGFDIQAAIRPGSLPPCSDEGVGPPGAGALRC
jgi:hypothetical protein